VSTPSYRASTGGVCERAPVDAVTEGVYSANPATTGSNQLTCQLGPVVAESKAVPEWGR
jgi:hypothetical protein